MAESGMSPADIMAIAGKDNDGFMGSWIWVFFLFFLLAWGGNGIGGFGAGGSNALTQAELQRGFDTNSIMNKLNSIGDGICSLGYENAQLANQTQAQIANLGFQMQNCCCGIERAIDASTRTILDKMCEREINDLRDRLALANQALTSQTLANDIVAQVRPFPAPAYITCSPYQAVNSCCANSCCGC